jgi:hypothetical protein
VAPLTGGDAGRLLPAVLERIKTEVGEARDVAAGCIHAEHPALIARAIAIGNVGTRVGQVCGRYLNLLEIE